jgi:hypothetical protein
MRDSPRFRDRLRSGCETGWVVNRKVVGRERARELREPWGDLAAAKAFTPAQERVSYPPTPCRKSLFGNGINQRGREVSLSAFGANRRVGGFRKR